MLQDKIIGIYCIIDDILKESNSPCHGNQKFTDSQVFTTAIVSCMLFNGNQSSAILYMKSHIFSSVIHKSGFTKRLHKLKEHFMTLLFQIGRIFKYLCGEMEYVIDSFPVKVCHNIRIQRCKLLQGEEYRGYNASKREYFYGFKVHLITTKMGVPVEIYFVNANEHDSQILQKMYHDLPPGSSLYGDSAYTHYEIEDFFRETEQVHLQIARKSNAKRKDSPSQFFIKQQMRKVVETSISQISAMMPKRIAAVTIDGFMIKIILFVMALQLKAIMD